MHKILALYPPPKDPTHFKKYYEEKHLPLAGQIPGLLSSRHTFAIEGVASPSPYFCIWEGEFANAASFAASMQSEIGQKVAADIANYATGGVTILHFDVPASSQAQPDGKKDTFSAGLQIRCDMFGPANAEQAVLNATDFTRTLQELVTRYCFGEVWARSLLDRKTRSMLTMALLVALNRPQQLRGHVRGAVKNGVSKDEIREVLLHAMIYAGVPAGVDSFNHATEVLKELGLE
jgi:4-carboxymuconolactone decarboxylase